MIARENPFASRRIETLRFRFPAGENWETLFTRLEQHHWRGSIVGLHGTGKTTLLEQIIPHLDGRGFRPVLLELHAGARATELHRVLAAAAQPSPAFLLLDGAEQLSWHRWLQLRHASRRAAGLLITQHRPGRLGTVLETHTSSELLVELSRELLPTGLSLDSARGLLHRYGGNVRECFREMYDLAANDSQPCLRHQ